MKKNFLLLAMMCLTLLGGVKFNTLEAQGKEVTIDGTVGEYESGGSNYTPLNTKYKYNTSQQIYLKDELQMKKGSTIISVSFYVKTKQVDTERHIKVYMVNTTTSEFNPVDVNGINKYYFTKVEDTNLVFEGNVDITHTGWFTLNLKDSGFRYEGNNILLCVHDTGNSEAKNNAFNKYSDTEHIRCIYKNHNATDYDPTTDNGISVSCSNGQKYIPYVKFTYNEPDNNTNPPGAATELNPNNSNYGSNPQTLTWKFGANTKNYKVLFGTVVKDNIVENEKGHTDFVDKGEKAEYTVEGLDPKTTYYWQVVSKNDHGEQYSQVAIFTTVDASETAMVEKLFPENNATIKTNELKELRWKFGNDSHTQYTILLGESTDKMKAYSYEFVDPNYTEGKEYTYKFEEPLKGGKTYYWSVDVKNAFYESKDANIWSFTTIAVGNINGVLKDNDTPLIQAKIALKDINDNNNAITDDNYVLTDNNGNFTFENIATGSYKLVVEEYGYATNPYTTNITITEGENDITIYKPAIITYNDGWMTSFGTINEHNELIVRANAVLETTSTVGTLTIENGKSVTISDGGILIVKGKVNNNGNIIIEDGGQIFQTNEGVNATFVMNINTWNSEKSKGWQFISSPFTGTPFANFTNVKDDYDFYRYDATKKGAEWVNFKNQDQYNIWGRNFEQGHAYLASYKSKENASLTGTINTYKTVYIGNLNYNSEYVYGCFNLLGNPFPYDIEWSDFSAEDIVEGYVVITEDGGYKAYTSGIIKAGDGFFVKATGTNGTKGNRAQFEQRTKPITPVRKQEHKYINIIASNNEGDDNVIINFTGKNEGFPKMQNINENIANIYVNEDDVRYCIYNCDSDVKEIEVMFSAKQMGNYSISLDVNGEFETVTLVDRFTGIETNMLIEDEYNFTATSNDSHNRFVVRLVNGQQPTDNSQFVYQSGEELIINAEGTIQIIDMMGRVVYSNEHSSSNNRINVAEFKDATYVVRVVNEEGVKVQKVVIY